jgi:hypothetical protein
VTVSCRSSGCLVIIGHSLRNSSRLLNPSAFASSSVMSARRCSNLRSIFMCPWAFSKYVDLTGWMLPSLYLILFMHRLRVWVLVPSMTFASNGFLKSVFIA